MDLSKSYKQNVFKEFNLKIRDEFVLLLGSNGSGKSTLIKCILSLINYEGNISIDGLIGYIPENFQFPMYVKVESFIRNLASITNSEFEALLVEYDLYEHRNKYIYALSKGMKQKLVIIQALVHNPDILICDEPINGLDLKVKKTFIEMLHNQKLLGKTILLASHYEDMYVDMADKVINLDETD